jgi:uncharacterized protein
VKQASWLDNVPAVGHWRTYDGQEVDLVVENYDGSVCCFEVKAHSEASARDTSGLRALRDLLGEQFHAGFVLTTGTHSGRIDDRIYVAPIDKLWQPAPIPNTKKRPRSRGFTPT